MAADGSVIIDTFIDTRGFGRGVTDMRGQFGRLAGRAREASAGIVKSVSGTGKSFDGVNAIVKKLGLAIGSAFAVGKLAQFGKEATRLGSELQEVENIVAVAFPHMTEGMEEFAGSAAKNFGLSETMAKRYSALYGTMAKQFNFTEKEAFEMGIALAGLAGDVASFYDISQDLAYIKLKSVFSGETETLKDIGVVMTEAALNQYALANGIDKTVNKMTEQEKVALRYQFVLKQLSQASGDFIRTSDSWANQTRVLKLQFDSLKATLGQGFINVLTPVVKTINALLAKLMTLAQSFKSFTELITGNKSSASQGAGLSGLGAETTDGYNDAADGAENLANATDKAAEATKEAEEAAEGYLSPIDEIHKLAAEDVKAPKDEEGPAGSGADLSPAKGVDFGELAKGEPVADALAKKLSALANLIKKEDWEGLGRMMASGINKGLQKIYDAINWGNVGPKITKFVNAFTRTFNSLVDNIDWDLLGRAIGTGINTLVNTFNLLIGEGGIDFANLGRKLSVGLRGMIGEINWTNLGNLFGNYFMVSWRTLSGFVEGMSRKSGAGLTGWAELGIAIGQAVNGMFEKIDFGMIGTTLALGFNGAFETLKNVALTVDWDGIAANVYTGINNLIHGINWAEAGKSLSLFATKLLGAFREVAENTDWEGLGRGIGEFLSNIDWGTILGDVFAILKEVLFGLIEGLGQTTAGKFILAFAGLSLALKGITVTAGVINSWKALYTTFKFLIPAVTNLAGGIKTLMSGGLLSGAGLISKLANAFALAAGGAGTLNEAFVAIFGTAGTLVAGIASTVLGAVLAVTNFFSMLKEGFSWLKEILMVIGIALAAVGAVILGAPAAVAAAVAGIVAAVATLVVVVKEHWGSICEFFSGVA